MHRVDSWKTSAYAFVPHQTHFGELTGFADDVIAGGGAFGMHPHQDMEISTVMLRGAQVHRDTTGAERLLSEGSVQTMSAGTGIRHSEANASATESFHSFQIWVYPRQLGVPPRYDSFSASPEQQRDRFVLALSPDGREGSGLIGQDAFFSLGALQRGVTRTYALHASGHGVYVHCVHGRVEVAGVTLGAGDALGAWETDAVTLIAEDDAQVVLVEVPMARGVRV